MHPTLVINETAPILENRCTINIVDMDTQFIYPYCVADTSFFFNTYIALKVTTPSISHENSKS